MPGGGYHRFECIPTKPDTDFDVIMVVTLTSACARFICSRILETSCFAATPAECLYGVGSNTNVHRRTVNVYAR